MLFFCCTSSIPEEEKRAKYLSMRDGLSSQQVLDVTPDRYGFIWIAQGLGLNRFASNLFKQYYKNEAADAMQQALTEKCVSTRCISTLKEILSQ